MSLITCLECKKEVSDQATACPHCGNPIHENLGASQKVIVEPLLTSKKWKRVKIVAWVIIVIGLMIISSGEISFQDGGFVLGFFLIFVGAVCLIVGKIGAWYADRRTR